MFGSDRESMRRFYVEAWRKAQAGERLEPMERLVAEVVADHPEYQALLAPGNEGVMARDYQPEDGQTNPFLHMGLHLALREQVATDRPPGVRAVFERLAARTDGTHEAEHRMIECLAETLWEAQRDGRPPDEAAYLESLRRLGRGR